MMTMMLMMMMMMPIMLPWCRRLCFRVCCLLLPRGIHISFCVALPCMWFVTCLWFLISNSIRISPQASIDILRLYCMVFVRWSCMNNLSTHAPTAAEEEPIVRNMDNGSTETWGRMWIRPKTHSCHDECAFAVCVCACACSHASSQSWSLAVATAVDTAAAAHSSSSSRSNQYNQFRSQLFHNRNRNSHNRNPQQRDLATFGTI